MKNKILLTGANGFIGQNLLKMSACKFRCAIRSNIDNSFDDVFIYEDLNDDTDWSNAFDNIESIIHLAGIAHTKCASESDFYNVNTLGTLKLAKEAAFAGVKRFVFVSSIGVNGSITKDEPINHHSKVRPHNAYTISKLNAEQGLLDIAKETGLEVVIVRPALVYGVNAPGNFGLLVKLINSLPVLPFGSVNNKRSFISVYNLCDLLLLCAKHPNSPGNVFLASDGTPISTKFFIEQIAKGVGKPIYQLPIPIWGMRLFAKIFGKKAMAEQLFDNLEVDSSLLFDVLNWVPPYSMEQTMNALSEDKK